MQSRAQQKRKSSSLTEPTVKRLHVHVAVENLQHALGFYSALFAAPPSVVKSDYAKWMLDDPRVNFAISARGRQPGLDHLGIQVEDADELRDVYARLQQAGGSVVKQGETDCCYARSEKSWIDDPTGIAWETFLTIGGSTGYGNGGGERHSRSAKGKMCCAPKTAEELATAPCRPV
jgi:predicted enzyme related to lactoylglutathione lyase